MSQFRKKWMIALGALLLAPLFSLHAAEIVADSVMTEGYDVNFNKALENDFLNLEKDLDLAIQERKTGDLNIRADLNLAVTQFTHRLDTVEASINKMDARYTDIKTLLRADIDATKIKIKQLETELHGNLDYLDFRINQTYNHINNTVANLQGQINNQHNSVSDLYTSANQINATLNSLEGFSRAISTEMARLSACVADTSCLADRSINVERQVVSIYTGEAIGIGTGSREYCARWNWFFGIGCDWWATEYYTIYGYGTKALGMYYPTWPYCSITMAQNQDVRNFRIYIGGNNQWTLHNETISDSGAANQQEGYVQATCMRFI